MPSKKVLVTGGTRGIGLAIAKKFQAENYHVTITGRGPSSISKELGFNQLNVDFLKLESKKNFFSICKDTEFDIVINNAGINKIGPITELSQEDWSSIIEVNLSAVFSILQAVLPSMERKRFGRIVNITSIFGYVSKEFRAPYSASKFGLFGLTKSIALEHAKSNILCNCLAPGFIDTELTRKILSPDQMEELISQVPLKRLGTPEEIAEAVYFLGSETNTFITGQNIISDGGFTSA